MSLQIRGSKWWTSGSSGDLKKTFRKRNLPRTLLYRYFMFFPKVLDLFEVANLEQSNTVDFETKF